MSWRDDLSADELREIFDRKIAPTLTAGGAAELHPSVVFVGAQPGAGKSRAIADVHSEHPGAVPVIGDDFRAFHPDYRALMRTEPLAMPHVTAQASGAWVGMAADYLRAERRSVILETTMRQLPVVESTAAAFRTQGYRVEAHVLAVPGAVSALGDRRRHRRGARRGDTGPTECRCGGCPRGSGHGRGSGVRRIRRFDRSTCRCRGNGRTGQPRRDCPRPVRGLRDDEKPPARDDDGFRPRSPTAAASQPAGPTATGVLGTAEPALPRTASTASRIGVSSGPVSGIPVVTGAPSDPVPTAHAGAQETDAVPPALSPDAPTTAAPAISASAPAPAASASTGDAPVPPAAVGSAPPPTPVAAAAPAAVAAARPALLPQITAPVISLAQAPDGDHSLTLTVSPENLGPVTVRAHISGGAIHIELHAPNDLGREALRAILVDLRRDLAAAAPQASLLLSASDDRPASSNPQHSAHNSTGGGTGSSNGATTGTNSGEPGAADARGRDAAHPASGDRASTDLTSPTDPASPVPLISPHGGIDVFA